MPELSALKAHFEIEEPASRPHPLSPKSQRSMSFHDVMSSTRSWAAEHLTMNAFRAESNEKQHYDLICNVLLVVLVYSCLLFILGTEEMSPGGHMWVLMLIWICSLVGGSAMISIGMPPLLGMLISGMLLKNFNVIFGIEGADPVAALPNSWSEGIRASGLSVILMRSGLELDIPAVKKAGLAAVKLTMAPGICEAFVSGLAAMWIFEMPAALAISLGFILAAVSPAVVVVGMFDLQKAGYGVLKGIPSLVVAAASFDDVVAISGFSMAIGFAITDPKHSLFEVAMHGPLTVIIGVALGFFGGGCLSMTKIWNKRWKRTFAVMSLGLLFMFGMVSIDFAGAGAMGGLIMGMVGSVCWREGKPSRFAKRGDENYIHHAESDLALIWSLVSQPLLFGVIGAALDFSKIDASTIPKSIAVVCLGLLVRLPMAYASTHGKNMTTKERGFIALSWIPKATVQAALCSLPLDLVKQKMVGDPEYDKYVAWGEDILATAVFSILITAPMGLIFIQVLGPKWLSCDLPEKKGGGGEVFGDEEDGVEHDTSMSKEDEEDAFMRKTEILENQMHDPDGSDATSILKKKLHTISVLMDEMKDDGSFAKFDQVKKLIWQVERISELCTLEVGGQKSLDTAGNFFKVVNSGGAALSQKKKVRKTITGSIDRGGSFRLGKDDRRASDPANIRGERKERSLSEGEESNRSLALVKPHANTVL